jgi:hypothetical protein
MSDSVKQKRLSHCPLFYWGVFISYAGHQLLAIAAMKGKWEKSKAAYYCHHEGKTANNMI